MFFDSSEPALQKNSPFEASRVKPGHFVRAIRLLDFGDQRRRDLLPAVWKFPSFWTVVTQLIGANLLFIGVFKLSFIDKQLHSQCLSLLFCFCCLRKTCFNIFIEPPSATTFSVVHRSAGRQSSLEAGWLGGCSALTPHRRLNIKIYQDIATYTLGYFWDIKHQPISNFVLVVRWRISTRMWDIWFDMTI